MSRNIGSTQSTIVPSFPEDPLQSPIDDLNAILNITHPRHRPGDGTEEEDPPEVNSDFLPARNIIDIRFSEDEIKQLLRALVALQAAQQKTDRDAITKGKNQVKEALTSFHKMAADMLKPRPYVVEGDELQVQTLLRTIEEWRHRFQKDNRRLLSRLFPGPLTINRKSEKNTTATNRQSGIRLTQEVNSGESQHEPRASQYAGPQQAWSNVSYAPTNASYVPEDDEIRSLDGSSNLDTEAATTNVPDITEDAPLLEGAVDSTMNSRFSGTITKESEATQAAVQLEQ
ncbi:hypothetical protein QFC21_004214 [Naganishia friedmannii]|uniref:Uncharacterized protein n=1 Tax=Naganishia friedmannii TaxID=89922 RepID=A0ACC2VJS5_9TREE|nr:hypothetical protein QFC21_004214 [Naganishia friedmannii]